MLQIAGNLGFGNEPIATDRVFRMLGLNLFKCDPAAKLRILSEVDFAQPAPGVGHRT